MQIPDKIKYINPSAFLTHLIELYKQYNRCNKNNKLKTYIKFVFKTKLRRKFSVKECVIYMTSRLRGIRELIAYIPIYTNNISELGEQLLNFKQQKIKYNK